MRSEAFELLELLLLLRQRLLALPLKLKMSGL
jgi:hypothetical protein